MDQDEGCPAFDELFCVVGELMSGARVVVISVDSGAAQAAGGVAFLQKPVDFLRLKRLFFFAHFVCAFCDVRCWGFGVFAGFGGRLCVEKLGEVEKIFVVWSGENEMKIPFTKILLASAALYCFSNVSFAETVPGTDFSVHFESSNIVGTGRTINMHRVPVVINSTGDVILYNASFDFKVDSIGQLVFDRVSLVETPTLNSADNFIPGTYEDQLGNKYLVSGGGRIGDRTAWSIRSLTEEVELNANWVSGSVKNHPLISGKSIAEKLVDGPSYGVSGTKTEIGRFSVGGLIGVIQVGNGISLSSYRYYSSSTDSSFAQSTLTITLVE